MTDTDDDHRRRVLVGAAIAGAVLFVLASIVGAYVVARLPAWLGQMMS